MENIHTQYLYLHLSSFKNKFHVYLENLDKFFLQVLLGDDENSRGLGDRRMNELFPSPFKPLITQRGIVLAPEILGRVVVNQRYDFRV